jgi:hypothetical protein
MLKKSPSVVAKVPLAEVPVDTGAEDVFDEVAIVELPDVTNPILEVCSVEGRKETTDDALVFEVVCTDDEAVVVVFTELVALTADELAVVAEAVPGTHCA